MYICVIVRHNLVKQIQRQNDLIKGHSVLKTNLEAGTLLTKNFQANGCIDGNYYFDDPERAKTFATVCMDFTQKLLQSRLDRIRNLNSGEEFTV